MKKIFLSCLVFLAMATFMTSCSSDSTPIPSVDEDENPDGGGDGNTALTPDDEKAFIKETFEQLSKYIVADEFTELISAAKQFNDVNADEVDDALSSVMTETLTGTRVGTISYYDRYIILSNLQGTYEAQAGGKWEKTSDTGDFTCKFTDNAGALWVFGIKATGLVAEKVHLFTDDDSYHYYYPVWNNVTNSYSYEEYKGGEVAEIYVDIPQNINVTFTCNGVSKVAIDINIDSFNETPDGAVQSLLTSCSGSATVSITPAADTYKCHTTFVYTPNGTPNVSTVLSKASVTLISVSGSADYTYAGDDGKTNDRIENVTAQVDILGRLQVHATVTDVDKVDGEYRGFENLADAEQKKTTINNYMNAYITNNGGTVEQGKLQFDVNPYETYTYNYMEGYKKVQRYELVPVLCFSDNTSYAFVDYFTESYFKDLIDFADNFVSSISRQLR